jgi:minor fimbrial subunit
MNRAVGSPSVLEGPFTGTENGACLIFRDQSGAEWSTNYYGYACGNSKLPPSTPDNCGVTTAGPWDIQFGNLERGDIPVTGGVEKTKDLTITCTGDKQHDFSVKLSMSPTTWSTTQLMTSNDDLGVQVTVGGGATKLGSAFSMSVKNKGSETLGFSILRNPKVGGMSISTGAFTASGTLIVTEQ